MSINNIRNIIKVMEYPQIDVDEELKGGLIPDEIIKQYISKHTEFITKFTDNQNFFVGVNNGNSYNDDPNNPNNTITIPYARTMCDTVKGYMYKPGLIRYSIEDVEYQDYFDRIEEIYEKNHEPVKNAELGECQSKYGIGFEMHYISVIDGVSTPMFMIVDPKEIIPVFDWTIDKKLISAIRYYTIKKNYETGKETKRVEVYYQNVIKTYKLENDRNTGKPALIPDADYVNNYGEIPLSIYRNNNEYMADYEPVRSLLVLLDELLSDAANELNRFAAAYMILKNVIIGGDDETSKAKMQKLKEMRVFQIGENGDITFLTKDIPTAFFQELKSVVREEIAYHSHIPDFRDQAFGTASGIAIRYKILNFENLCADKESWFRLGLERRKQLIDKILNIQAVDSANIIITFNRNLPYDDNTQVAMIQQIKSAQLPVSNTTLLGQLSFIKSPEKEIEKYEEEKAEKQMQNPIDVGAMNPEIMKPKQDMSNKDMANQDQKNTGDAIEPIAENDKLKDE